MSKKKSFIFLSIFLYILIISVSFYPINKYVIDVEKKQLDSQVQLRMNDYLEAFELISIGVVNKYMISKKEESKKLITEYVNNFGNHQLFIDKTTGRNIEFGCIDFFLEDEIKEEKNNVTPSEILCNKMTASLCYYDNNISNIPLVDIWYKFKLENNICCYLKTTVLLNDVLVYVKNVLIKKNNETGVKNKTVYFLEQFGVYAEVNDETNLLYYIFFIFSVCYIFCVLVILIFNLNYYTKTLNKKSTNNINILRSLENEKYNLIKIGLFHSFKFDYYSSSKKFTIKDVIENSISFYCNVIKDKNINITCSFSDEEYYTYDNYTAWNLFFCYILDVIIENSPPNSNVCIYAHYILTDQNLQLVQIEITDDVTFGFNTTKDIHEEYPLFGYINIDINKLNEFLNVMCEFSCTKHGNQTLITLPLKKQESFNYEISNVIPFSR